MKIRHLINRISNLRRWLPVIWSDCDWDYSFLLEILEFKFRNTAEFFESDHAMCADHERIAKQIRTCRDLCKRIRLDEYADAAIDAHDRKWGKLDIIREPTGHQNSRLIFKRSKVVDQADELREDKEFRDILLHAEYQRREDVNYLCSTISKYLLCWWD